MRNPIEAIVAFNQKAGLLDSEFNDLKESAYLVEEALEPYDVAYLASLFSIDETSHKSVARAIVANTSASKEPITKVVTVDKYLDAIVFAVGALAKQGLSHQDITHLLNVVTLCNMKKLTVGTDSEGKQLKPDDWVGPEERIYSYLDKRSLL